MKFEDDRTSCATCGRAGALGTYTSCEAAVHLSCVLLKTPEGPTVCGGCRAAETPADLVKVGSGPCPTEVKEPPGEQRTAWEERRGELPSIDDAVRVISSDGLVGQ